MQFWGKLNYILSLFWTYLTGQKSLPCEEGLNSSMMRSLWLSCLLIGWLVGWAGSVRSGRLSLLSSLSICSSIHSSSDSSPAESRVLRLTLASRLRRSALNTQTLVKHQVGRWSTIFSHDFWLNNPFKSNAMFVYILKCACISDTSSSPWPGQHSEEPCRQAPARCVISGRQNVTLYCCREQTDRQTQGFTVIITDLEIFLISQKE